MWLLKDSSGKLIYLKPNKVVTVSRKQGDIILQKDESISRVHASIIVQLKEEVKINEPTSLCIVKDTGSKYGSFVLRDKEQKQITKEGCSLNSSDRIRFGLQHHIFTVLYIPIISVTSSINDNDKNELQSIINAIDGMIMPDWVNSCTHLTVSVATLTEKVACALASGIPIVDIKYWKEVLRAVEANQVLPDPVNFVVPINEGTISNENVSLCPNNMRKTLFKNLVFVHFTSRQYNLFVRMIRVAGGKSLLYEKKPLNNKEICADNVVVLQISSASSQLMSVPTTSYEPIYEVLRKNKRRMIPEFEIPLAILYCSTKQYCNPKFDFAQLLNAPRQKNVEGSTILALDTQDAVKLTLPQEVKIIPESPIQREQTLEATASSSARIVERTDETENVSNSVLVSRKEIQMADNTIIDETRQDSELPEKIIEKVVYCQEGSKKVVCKPTEKEQNLFAFRDNSELAERDDELGEFSDSGSRAFVKSSKISNRSGYEKQEVGLTLNVNSISSQIISDNSKGLKRQKQSALNVHSSEIIDNFIKADEIDSNKSNKKLGGNSSSANALEAKALFSWMNSAKEHIGRDSETNDKSVERSDLTTKRVSRKRNASIVSNEVQQISTESGTDISSDDESRTSVNNKERFGRQKAKYLKLSTPSRINDRIAKSDRKVNLSVGYHVKIEKSSEENDDPFADVGKTHKRKGSLAANNMWGFKEDTNVKSDSDNDMFKLESDKITRERKSTKRKRNQQCKSLPNVESTVQNKLSQHNVEFKTCDSDEQEVATFDCTTNDSDCYNCTSTVTSLLRTDMDIDQNNIDVDFKAFKKVYDLIPVKRITLDDMYVWDIQNDTFKDEFRLTHAPIEHT